MLVRAMAGTAGVVTIQGDSPRWNEINASVWEHERAGLQHIKSLLPDADPYLAWANVEFVAPDGSVNEVDLLVLTPSGLYLVELKNWQGEISGDGSQWVRRSLNGRTRREDNPLILANRKAKRLANLLHHYAPQSGRRIKVPYIRSVIFLHGPRLKVRLDQVGRQGVYGLPGRDLPDIADLLTRNPTDLRDMVDRTRAREIKGLIESAGIRPSVADRTVLQLLLETKPYAEGPGWQDFLAQHKVDPTIVRRVRFYLTSKAGPDDRDIIQRAAEREFRLLQGIHHPGIAHATDLVDHELGPAVIFEHDRNAVRFDHWLAEHGDRLTVDDRLNLVRELAEIVRYAYSRHLVHRGLNPHTILVCDPDRPSPDKPSPDRPHPRLVVTDWQTGGRAGTSTTPTPTVRATGHIDHLSDDMTRLYQAPELASNPEAPGHLLDVFALGALTYLIFTGRPPAETPAQLQEAIRERGGLELTAAVDGVPETLSYLVYDATSGDTTTRTKSAARFLSGLESVEDELTTPEPGPVIDPLEARVGETLDGGFIVTERLGSGATAVGLKVRRTGDDTPLVLKVARDEDKGRRLHEEAERLRNLRHPLVAHLMDGPLSIGGRTSLLLDFAGTPTLAEELQAKGRLDLEFLERYGRDLLEIVAYLDGQGVIHRDIKPANLAARPRPRDRQKHLCIFDFSLANTPADQLTAGTPPYLDPFLGPPHRPRFDLAAERFAAAVTLYELATGMLPRWGDGIAHPAAIPDEVTITRELFDPAVADPLGEFFARALARDARDRFDTIEEMADAWRSVFTKVAAAPEPPADTTAQRTTRDTPLDLAGLTARARSALERLGVRTVGDLVDYSAMALSGQDDIPRATKAEIRRRAKELRALPPGPDAVAEPAAGQPRARSVDSLVELLVPKATTKNRTEVTALRVMLGLEPAGEGAPTFLHWPAQKDVAPHVGLTQPQLSRMMTTRARRWAGNEDLAEVRDEIVALLDTVGGVMSAVELAQALIASRGTYATEPRRTAQAIGLVHAAVEAELSRGGDARVGTRKFSGGVLIASEPDDPTATHTSEDLLRYAVQLGRVAQKLAEADSLPTPARAIERLRQVRRPPAMPELSDSRLVQLAAAAGVRVAVNTQLQLYPEGMAAERALRLAAGSLALPRGQTLSVDKLRKRVESRFPRAASLPQRPALDRLLASCGIALEWDHTSQVYRPPAASSGSLFATPTRTGTLGGRAPAGADTVSEAQTRIVAALDRNAFLALLTAPSDVTRARRALLDKLPLSEVDVTRILVETLRSVGVPWELVITSDGQPRTHPDRRNLENAVRHAVLPRITAAIADAPGPVLLTEASPLARYDCMDLIARLADNAAPRPAARLLLVAARRQQPVLDTEPIPVLPAQWLWLPEAWYSATPYSPKDET